jgi:UDP-N-acetylmuramate dehydrogenase
MGRAKLKDDLPACCQSDVDLAPMTYCKIGGVAKVFCVLESEADLMEAIEYRKASGLAVEDAFVLGGGANVLINDARDYGLVLKLSQRFNAIQFDETAQTARIEAGIYTPRLVREAAVRGWDGFQFLAGVPGSLGGAIVMNAGIRELSIWNLFIEIEAIDWDGKRHKLTREDLKPGYRKGNVPADVIVTAATCAVQVADPETVRATARSLSSSRREAQPLQFPSWGSTFMNPSGASSTGQTAGALIDAAGLKGHRVGDAEISEVHANFIVNRGNATAADALACIRLAYQTVRDRFQIRLEPEVRLIGFSPSDLAFLEDR